MAVINISSIALAAYGAVAERLRNFGVERAANPPAAPSGKLDLSHLSGNELAAVAHSTQKAETFVKRALDIAASLSLLIIFSPILAAAIIAIKLDSPGPAFYRQSRVGQGGRVFSVFKLRSMVKEAEIGGPQFAARNDSRITRVGRFIRRARIDEIPQAINVLRGEMSFVGPRPERPEFVEILEARIPHYHRRHLVKPGITGWAQVKYEYAATVAGARPR